MGKYESFEACEFLKLQSEELPKDIFLATHERSLRKTLLGSNNKEGKLETLIASAREALSKVGVAFLVPVWKPALGIVTVLAITLALLPVLTSERQSPANPIEKLTASQIALADPQVRATFSNEDLSRINVREMDADNGQKVVLLTCDAAILAVGVDMIAMKVAEWLINVPGFQPAPVPTGPYQLLFESRITGKECIYVVNNDGSSLTKLTDDEAMYREADWSAINQKIVLIVQASYAIRTYPQTYTMNADGTDLTQIIGANEAFPPKWSPDGTKIAYTSNNIFVVNADGSNPINLTNNRGHNIEPQWSPDGRKIAYASNIDGNWELYTINIDGTGMRNITDNPATDGGFVWSPDGKQIAFTSNRGDNFANYNIYITNADGSNTKKLTRDNAYEYDPAWSPDGTKIAFYSNISGYKEIYTINPDGTGMTKLTDNKSTSLYPVWSPDSRQIAYNVWAGSIPELYVMNADGSNPVRVSENGYKPIWVALPSYPAPIVSQQYEAVPQPMHSSEWPVKSDQAKAIASSYLPADVVSKATITVGTSWSGDKPGEGEPRYSVVFDNLAVSKTQLDRETRLVLTKTGNTITPVLPIISLQGEGPYLMIFMGISGLDGSLVSLFGFSAVTGKTLPTITEPESQVPTPQKTAGMPATTTKPTNAVTRDNPLRPTFDIPGYIVPNMIGYEVQLSTDPSFPANNTISQMSQEMTITWDTDLAYGTTYFARYRIVYMGVTKAYYRDWEVIPSYTSPPAP